MIRDILNVRFTLRGTYRLLLIDTDHIFGANGIPRYELSVLFCVLLILWLRSALRVIYNLRARVLKQKPKTYSAKACLSMGGWS